MHIGGLKSIAKAFIANHDTIYGYSDAFQKGKIGQPILEQSVPDSGKILVGVLEDGSRIILAPTLTWSGDVLATSVRVRSEYISDVSSLPSDTPKEVRSAIKETYRLKTPQPVRDIISRIRPSTGPRPGSGGRVNVTNPNADALGQTLGRIGNLATAVVVEIEVYSVYDAPEGRRLQYTAGAGGRILGAIAGRGLGTWAGAKIGGGLALLAGQAGPQAGAPEEVATVPIAGVVGGVIGGIGPGRGDWWGVDRRAHSPPRKSIFSSPQVKGGSDNDRLSYRVAFDREAIRLYRSGSEIWGLHWIDIELIGYRTSPSGPWFDDHFLVFRRKGDNRLYDVSLDWDGAVDLANYVDRLDDTRLTEKGSLVSCTDEDSVVIWPSRLAGQRIT